MNALELFKSPRQANKWENQDYDCTVYHTEDNLIVNKYEYFGQFQLYVVDHEKVFNKDSQCPICFEWPLTEGTTEELKNALEFLATKEGREASSKFEFEKFPESFGQKIRTNFYQNF